MVSGRLNLGAGGFIPADVRLWSVGRDAGVKVVIFGSCGSVASDLVVLDVVGMQCVVFSNAFPRSLECLSGTRGNRIIAGCVCVTRMTSTGWSRKVSYSVNWMNWTDCVSWQKIRLKLPGEPCSF